MYYARACDNFHVTLCSGVLGRTAFNALRNIASQGRSLMKAIQFSANITNRIAYGMSALAIGGRCHFSAAERFLGTGNFPQTSGEQFDSFLRHATTLLAWHRDALRMSWAVGSRLLLRGRVVCPVGRSGQLLARAERAARVRLAG